jgi:alpha,alpha-trehalose phosphorylase
MALVAGFGGMRHRDDTLAFAPRLPGGMSRLMFRLRYRGRRLCVTISHRRVRYELLDGEPISLFHHGEKLMLADKPVVRDVPPVKPSPPPRQPEGREPITHRPV